MTEWSAGMEVRYFKAPEIPTNTEVVQEVVQFKRALQEYPKETIVNAAVVERAPRLLSRPCIS